MKEGPKRQMRLRRSGRESDQWLLVMEVRFRICVYGGRLVGSEGEGISEERMLGLVDLEGCMLSSC
jgi:hypothetical protein